MKCAIMQPTYLPWLGYFELMLNCDCFVYFDDVQFAKKSWQQRNRIKSSDGELMLSVPVLKKGEFAQKVNEARINNQENWRHKHLASIEKNYCKAPYFNRYIDGVREIYSTPYDRLIDLNIALIEFVRLHVGIDTPTVLSSELNPQEGRDERILDICHKTGSNVLYDAAGAAEFLDATVFAQGGVTLLFQQYRHPVYRQLHGEFIPYLSALDLLLNEGEKSRDIIVSGALS